MNIYRNLILVIFVSLFFVACGGRQAILSENLSPNINGIKTQNIDVNIVVDGGREKDALGLPKITNEKLLKAVTKTIKNSKLFNNIVENSNYSLELFIVKLGQPVAGKMMKSNVEIAWTLKKDSKVVWRKSIITSKAKYMNEISMGLERLIVATEEATKLNIEEGLRLLSTLDIETL